jgi:two-component system chemotaxis response regulator CheY
MKPLETLDRNMPILVVDDFSTMRKVVRNCLRQLGFANVTEAEDGQAALDKMKEAEFSFVISDWSMPNMMGIDLLKKLRGDRKYAKVPFLMVAAEAQKDAVAQATQLDASTYIVKPFTAQVLEQKMASIFGPEEQNRKQ